MDHLKRANLPEKEMLGRVTAAAFGLEGVAAMKSDVFVGWATFSPRYGEMKPHYHEDEIMYIVQAKDAFVRFGPAKDSLGERKPLAAGEMIRARSGEWHAFEFSSEEGVLDLVAIFGVPMCHTVED